MGLQIFVHRIPIDKPKQRSRTKSYREKWPVIALKWKSLTADNPQRERFVVPHVEVFKYWMRFVWSGWCALLVRLGVLAPISAEAELCMRDDLQVVWRNPTPPPQQKAQVSRGWSGDRLAIYPNGRQVWFEDVCGGHARTGSTPGILPADDPSKG